MRHNRSDDLLREYIRTRYSISETKILREYVRNILVESDGGMMYGDPDALAAIFITPFTDVFKTAAGEVKKVAVKTRTLATIAFKTIMTTILPFYSYDYDELFKKDKEDIKRINEEYKDVHDRTWAALKSSDALMLAFMASPTIFLAGAAALATPSIVKGTVSVLSGGAFDSKESKSEKGKKKEKHSSDEEDEDKDEKSGIGGALFGGAAGAAAGSALQKHFKEDPKRASAMQSSARDMLSKALSAKIAHVKKLTQNISSLDDLQKEVKKSKMPGSEKFDAEIKKINELKGGEKEKAEQILLVSVREAAKKFYVEKLESELKEVTDSLKSSSVDAEKLEFVKQYKSAIQTIKSIGVKKN